MGGGGITGLNGVRLTPLATIAGSQGAVMHVMTSAGPGFHGFGEAYFTTVDEGAVKGWKLHEQLVCNLVVPVGAVRFVLYDDREGSASRGQFEEAVLSPDDYRRLTIPNGVWFAFQGRAHGLNLVLNLANIAHVDGEQRSLPLENDLIPPYAF